MQALAIVEQLYVLENVLADLVYVGVGPTIDQFLLQAGEEALHRGIVVWATRRTHGGRYAIVVKHIAIPTAAVLRTAIRVENKVFVLAAICHGIPLLSNSTMVQIR